MHLIYLVSVWLHVLAAMVWIGGAAFIAIVLIPAMKGKELANAFVPALRATALRFRTVGWLSLGVLVVTGCLNLALRGFGWRACLSGAIFTGRFGFVLGAKLAVVALILGLSGYHDFILGPRAAEKLGSTPDPEEAIKIRRRAAWMGRTVLFLGVTAVALAVILVRGI